MAEEFRGEQFECLGENTEKYISFSVPIKKEHDNDSGETITYKIKFIDSSRFMPSKLSNLVDNMSGIFDSVECKSCMEKIKVNWEYCSVGFKKNRLIYRCKECKEEWKRPINELIEKFPKIYKFWKDNLNKFVMLLRKNVYEQLWKKLHYQLKKIFIVN